MNPLVSVHVTTYQHVGFIEQAIQSVLQQDYRPLQIVIGDDGSADGTGEIVERYARQYPDLIEVITQPHVGVLENANRVLRRCRGKYVAMLNGDDYYLPGKLSRQVAWLEADPSRVLCGHPVETFDSVTGKILKVDRESAQAAGTSAADFLIRGCPFAFVSVMVRSSALPRYGFDGRLQAALDYKLWLDVLGEEGRYGAIDGALARYRVHGNSFSATRSDDMDVDYHVARVAFEASHPRLVAASLKGRANRFRERAHARINSGDGAGAQALAHAALRLQPGAKSLVTTTWVHLPPTVRSALKRLRSILR